MARTSAPAPRAGHAAEERSVALTGAYASGRVWRYLSLAPTVGRADVGDNDIVTSVTPDDLHPVFGHYLRMTGNRTVAEYRYSATFGNVTETMEPPSVKEVYDIGLASLAPSRNPRALRSCYSQPMASRVAGVRWKSCVRPWVVVKGRANGS